MASLLDNIKKEDMSRIVEICEKCEFKKGSVIYSQGDIAWDMYIIRSGKVSLKVDIENVGRVTLSTVGPGSFIGDVSMINDIPREFTAIAKDDVIALKISKRDLDTLQRVNLPLATRFYLTIIRDINKKLKRLNNYYQEIKDRLNPSS
jgi:CRP-like cAMP-binding protein